MRHKVKKFSILMLVVFGFNLIAEIASSQFENPNAHMASSSSLSRVSGNSSTYENEGSQSQDVNTDHKGCMDPCHRGQCHFGHCAYHLTSGYPALGPDLFNLVHIDFGFLAPKSPFLDGPKRPPRHS
jgi:hypothetical protein